MINKNIIMVGIIVILAITIFGLIIYLIVDYYEEYGLRKTKLPTDKKNEKIETILISKTLIF